MSEERRSGGCQCGAVRYRVHGPVEHPHVCHCRMCQKAAGGWFMAFANARQEDFEITRGEIEWFQSSGPARRGFCRKCGTPLVVETIGDGWLSYTLGSLDDPASVEADMQSGIESRMPWLEAVASLPGETSAGPGDAGLIAEIARTNYQHPDHDTDFWPQEEER